ncbi:H-2 class I histocompatibility antigen, Q10 alpha chain-like [Festucalex cinctus]
MKMLKMNLIGLFVVAVRLHSVTQVSAVVHTLKYFQTTFSNIPNLPAYLEVAHVDDIQIVRYDSKSKKLEAKQDWTNKITADEPNYWQEETQSIIDSEPIYKVNIDILRKRFNQTGGVHMTQVMYGCEWDDETDEVHGWESISYDGEDFLSFELSTLRWIAVQPRAVATKHKWDQLDLRNQLKKYYYTEDCPYYLKKYVSIGRDFLMRTELPVVSLLQKTPSSPITCHASGFYPAASALFWRKDGEELHEDVEMGRAPPQPRRNFTDDGPPESGADGRRGGPLRMRLPAVRRQGRPGHRAGQKQHPEQHAHPRKKLGRWRWPSLSPWRSSLCWHRYSCSSSCVTKGHQPTTLQLVS